MSAMNVAQVVSRAAPRADARNEPRVSASRTERASRVEGGHESTEGDAKDASVRLDKLEFAQLLAMLAAQSDSATNAPAKPADAASLVDALLDETLTRDAGSTTPSFPGPVGAGLTLAVRAGATSDLASTEAETALRHGLLMLPRADRGDIIDLAAYAKSRQARLAGDQGVAGGAGALDNMLTMVPDSAADALSRVAARRGASVEQLLAVGDARGADARAALDALLARAGTPEGLKLADAANARALAQQLLSETQGRSLLGDATDEGARAAGMAHAAALAAGLAASAANPGTPVKDLSAVAPELRARVERVIDRMKQEYGHDVSVVETTRSQERQDWLYAQGRTRDGQVVTWTRDSAHTRGEAVDVIIDGRWDNPEGFGRLQRIAREEGLRTLGMKDPGHLELANGQAQDLSARVDALRVQAQRADAGSAMAASASTANVAQLSGVAQVAGVARVADSASPSTGAANSAAAYATLAAAPSARSAQQGSGNAFGRGTRDEQGQPLNDGRKLGHAERAESDASRALTPAVTSTTPAPDRTGSTTAVQASEHVGSTQAQRVSDIQALRADAPASPLNRMTLDVEGANGVQQQVTVDLRGNVVSTRITTDSASAERMRLRTADLQNALGRHGLDSDTVRISGLKPADATDGTRAVATDREALKVAASTPSTAQDGTNANGQRDRAPARDWNHDESRREQASRARDQREQRDEQSDRQRPRPDFLFGTP
jgi:peptidoglycan L-alanyl-D-glutamate endopeptidase CwlK